MVWRCQMVCGQLSVSTDRVCRRLEVVARTTKADLATQAEAAVARALRSLGHEVDRPPTDADRDLTATVDGIEVPVAITAAAVVTPETVSRMVARRNVPEEGMAHVAVGDLVIAAAQDRLREAGWGWLDRRGHLVLRATGVHIDADVPADGRSTAGAPSRPISGVAAVSWAAALLITPEDPPSMREVARRVALSHSAIVTAAKKLRLGSLVRADGRPLVPELFWALAEAWHPDPIGLAALPTPSTVGLSGALTADVDRGGPGWAVAGTVGAAAWGAPLAIGGAYPPDFYLPTTAELRQATLRLGVASRFDERACTVAVAPTPLVCVGHFDRGSNEWGPWRFAHGLFAALDLAQDRARGAEILGDWDPRDFTRVW